jgi:membrane protein
LFCELGAVTVPAAPTLPSTETEEASVKLLNRNDRPAETDDYYEERPEPDELIEPQPERYETRHADPGLTDLSKRDYVAMFKRAFKRFTGDNMTSIAAALAYYAFLAIPSVLLVAVGAFSLVAGPNAISTVIDKLGTVMPGQATTLLEQSLTTMTQHKGTGIAVLGIGSLLALWSLTGAMQNVIWATNMAYGRDEGRGFVRRRITAAAMVVFALVGFALLFGVLVLGPHLSQWVGTAVGQKTAVGYAWWIAEWPLLLIGLLFAFAGIMRLGPNVKHPKWQFLTIGAFVAIFVWLIASGAFAFYVSRFGSYNKTWGSLSAVVVMLTWLWLSSVALLFGVEVNAEAERSRELRRGEPAKRELQLPAKA